MSLAIDVNDILAVNVEGAGWSNCAKGSVTIDSYEYICQSTTRDHFGNLPDPVILMGGGQYEKLGIAALGISWRDKQGREWACPINRVLSVELDPWPDELQGQGRSRRNGAHPNHQT